MTLYSLNGSYPAPLPFRIYMIDGASRTDPSTFTPEEISEAGYVEAPSQPTYDPSQKTLGWDGVNWTLTDSVPPVVEPTPPALYAAGQLQITDMEVTGLEVNSRFGGAFWVDTGTYIVFFADPQPDTDYIVMATAGPFTAYVTPTEKYEDFFTLTVINSAGQPTDADFVNLSILRAS
jgi:hypothetical protein